MPTYDYRCSSCGHEFEVVQSIKDDALSVCPECEGELRRIISSNTRFILMGDGWESNTSKGKWHDKNN